MARHERWIVEWQRRLEASGHISREGLAALADAAGTADGLESVRSSSLLGSAHDLVSTRDALDHLARVWAASSSSPALEVKLRRDAARHLFVAGFAADGLALITEALDSAADIPELELSCRALAMSIQIDLGRLAHPPAVVAQMPQVLARLEARMPRQDRMWLINDLLQTVIALCWRSGHETCSLGSRLPRADAGQRATWMDMLRQLQDRPELTASDTLPRLRILHRLGQQTLGIGRGTLSYEQIMALVLRDDPPCVTAEVWSLLGFSCQLAGEGARALVCHQRAVALAGETGDRRAAALSNAELASLFAARGDHRAACACLLELREDEHRLWAEANLPMGRRWHRHSQRASAVDSVTEGGSQADLYVRRACTFIEQNLSRGLGTQEVATACGVSRRTIEQAFRDVLQCTIKQHVRRLRVAKVRHRLLTTTDPVKRIAHDLGYPSSATMGREFRLITGQAITEFRRSRLR